VETDSESADKKQTEKAEVFLIGNKEMKDTRIHIDILIDIEGNTMPLKALVNPGSEISIIKDKYLKTKNAKPFKAIQVKATNMTNLHKLKNKATVKFENA
jgi:hypothetical protein